jgi:threonine synthase
MAEVAKCPKCGKLIDETHETPWCTKCGEPLPEDIKSRLPKVVARRAAADAAKLRSDDVRGQSASPVVNRYRDAYRVGTALVGLGNAIKAVGAFLAGITLLVVLASLFSPRY